MEAQAALDDIEKWEIWAFVELGIKSDEFYALAPGKFYRYVDQWKEKQSRLDRRTAKVCMVIASCAGNKVKEDDFMPITETDKKTEYNPDEVLKNQFMVAMGSFPKPQNKNG